MVCERGLPRSLPNVPISPRSITAQATGVPKFLNRLLGLPLRDQELLFGYFLGIMDSLVKQVGRAWERVKRKGRTYGTSTQPFATRCKHSVLLPKYKHARKQTHVSSQARSAGDYDEAIVNIGHSAVKVVAQHQVHVDTPSGGVGQAGGREVEWADGGIYPLISFCRSSNAATCRPS